MAFDGMQRGLLLCMRCTTGGRHVIRSPSYCIRCSVSGRSGRTNHILQLKILSEMNRSDGTRVRSWAAPFPTPNSGEQHSLACRSVQARGCLPQRNGNYLIALLAFTSEKSCSPASMPACWHATSSRSISVKLARCAVMAHGLSSRDHGRANKMHGQIVQNARIGKQAVSLNASVNRLLVCSWQPASYGFGHGVCLRAAGLALDQPFWLDVW